MKKKKKIQGIFLRNFRRIVNILTNKPLNLLCWSLRKHETMQRIFEVKATVGLENVIKKNHEIFSIVSEFCYYTTKENIFCSEINSYLFSRVFLIFGLDCFYKFLAYCEKPNIKQVLLRPCMCRPKGFSFYGTHFPNCLIWTFTWFACVDHPLGP